MDPSKKNRKDFWWFTTIITITDYHRLSPSLWLSGIIKNKLHIVSDTFNIVSTDLHLVSGILQQPQHGHVRNRWLNRLPVVLSFNLATQNQGPSRTIPKKTTKKDKNWLKSVATLILAGFTVLPCLTYFHLVFNHVYHPPKLRISRIPPSSRPGLRCRKRSICLGSSSARPAPPLGAKRRQGPLREPRK